MARAAKNELKAKGFEVVSGGSSFLAFYKPTQEMKGPAMPIINASVVMHKDQARNKAGKNIYRPGWVTVLVFDREEPTFFDNLRSFLGI